MAQLLVLSYQHGPQTLFPPTPSHRSADSSYQEYCGRDVEDLRRDLLLVQPFVELRHVVLSSHLPLHVTEVMEKSFIVFIFFPHIPKQKEKCLAWPDSQLTALMRQTCQRSSTDPHFVSEIGLVGTFPGFLLGAGSVSKTRFSVCLPLPRPSSPQ